MKNRFKILAILLIVMLMSPAVWATNGTNLIGVGPISRAMGGVGIAAPQDAIGAVFANPAAMCFGPYCPSSEFNFAGTLFMPEVEASVSGPAVGGGKISGDSRSNVYTIPAIGVSAPLTENAPFWRFGLAAYGVSGLGVDYRSTPLDNPSFAPYGGAPLISGEYTQLQIMKFAPAIALQPSNQWSFGLAMQIDYATLDLRNGSSPGYAFGAQLGTIYKPTPEISLGLTYVTPQKVSHNNVISTSDPAGNPINANLDLESPQQVGFGAAYEWSGFLLEANAKWLNWSDADGYKDFDWDDQWVFAIGGQYYATEKLVLRAGYNFGENPVKENNGWDGGFTGPVPNDAVNVQGTIFPRYYYETFRIIGFPAIVEHHITLGVGYDYSPRFSFHLGFMYAPAETITETGTGPNGLPVTIESELSETSLDFGLTWRF